MTKRFSLSALIALCLSCFISCSNNVQEPKEQTSEKFDNNLVLIDTSEGVRVQIPILSRERSGQAANYIVKGNYCGSTIGFKMSISIKNSNIGILKMESLGIESDNFLKVFAKLYDIPISDSSHFVKVVSLEFLDLAILGTSAVEANQKTEVKSTKLFYSNNNHDLNAELYLNINESASWIQVLEKDVYYRENIIKFLSK